MCEKGHSQAGFAALHIRKAAAARNAARGYVRVPKTQASLRRLVPPLASWVQEMRYRTQRLSICVCLSGELPPPLCPTCVVSAGKEGQREG